MYYQISRSKELHQTLQFGESSLTTGDDTIIHFTMGGKPDKETAQQISRATLELIDTYEEKVNFLVDLNKVGQPTSDARKIFRDMHEHEKVNKTAIFGVHPVAKIIASFVILISRKGNQRFFTSREEAIAWLKS